MTSFTSITSRANPLLVRVRKLAADPGAYRKLGQAWIEGDHLCRAARDRGFPAAQALLAESAAGDAGLLELAGWARQAATVPDALFRQLSGLASPARIGYVMDLPAERPTIERDAPSLVLDRVQDAGNAGSLLRSAAAFGFRQVLAITGTAALWSPKVLRAGMGAHFGLRLVEGLTTADLDALTVPLLATGSHAGVPLPQAALPWPCAWVLGHEGQGVQPALAGRAALVLRIPQPGGEESLNVAAAGAVCLYESSRQRGS